jgi:hypothetical protein
MLWLVASTTFITLLIAKVAAMSVWITVLIVTVEVLFLMLIGTGLYFAIPIIWQRIKQARERSC